MSAIVKGAESSGQSVGVTKTLRNGLTLRHLQRLAECVFVDPDLPILVNGERVVVNEMFALEGQLRIEAVLPRTVTA